MKGKLAGVLLIGMLSGLLLACSSSPKATPSPSTSSHPHQVKGAPSLAFDKTAVTLGNVQQDMQGVATFLMLNWGDQLLQAGPATIEVEQGCDVAKAATGTTDVRATEAMLLPITLGPHKQLGPHKLRVRVPSTDPKKPDNTLLVSFNVVEAKAQPGAGPRLRVDKDFVDIGNVPYDWPLYEQFILRNDGDAPLVLQGVPVVRVEDGC